jgi:hypothetical protein
MDELMAFLRERLRPLRVKKPFVIPTRPMRENIRFLAYKMWIAGAKRETLVLLSHRDHVLYPSQLLSRYHV